MYNLTLTTKGLIEDKTAKGGGGMAFQKGKFKHHKMKINKMKGETEGDLAC